jgi:hypothetical protein
MEAIKPLLRFYLGGYWPWIILLLPGTGERGLWWVKLPPMPSFIKKAPQTKPNPSPHFCGANLSYVKRLD